MKIRKTQPKNNKYYIRKPQGGLSDAVFGKPVIKGANVLCNCVGYANSRFNEIWNDPDLEGIVKPFHVQLVCNAENFIESAKRQGLKISKTPIQGGIMVWQRGATLGGGDGAGHVAVVERVYEDGSILTSESGWDAWAFKTVRRFNTNGRWGQSDAYKFRGCIINPSVKNPQVVPAPKLNVDGVGGACTIRAMQKFFDTPMDGVLSGQDKDEKKYYPAVKSVEFGKGGSACVKKLQKWLGLTQTGVLDEKTIKAWQKMIYVASDGVFGANSMRAWQEYLNMHSKAIYPVSDRKTPQQKMVAWAKKIAKDDSFHYVHWKRNDPNTKKCPICHKTPKGKYHGWYCTSWVLAPWRHGAGIKMKCGNALNNGCVEKIYNAKTDAQALKLARKYLGVKDIKVIRSKKNLPQDKLKAGDMCYYFKGNTCQHAFFYIGNGKMIDANSYKEKSKQIAVRKAMTCKVAIRYVGK